MQAVLRDLRYGVRSLRKSPGLAVVAILALTLGIGLTTTMFSILYGALLKGLPVKDADRIMMVQANNISRNQQHMSIPVQDLADYRAAQKSFIDLAGSYSGTVNVSGTEKAERYTGSFVTDNTFDVLGVRPILGRSFRKGEDLPSAERVAVLGYSMWQSRFGGDRDIIGKPIRANGVPYTVIGVMPEKFLFPDNSEIWLPLGMDPVQLKRGDGNWLEVIGKLKPGVSLDQANADLGAIAKRLQTTYKETNEGVSAAAVPYIEGSLGNEPRQLLLTMLGAVMFVLLIACANVANLLLDRAAHRTKEVGIRTALGASRGAVIRQFLTEALLLAIAGALLGLGVAQTGITMFNRAIVDTQPPYWIDIRLHPPVLLFVAAIAALSSIVSGAIPAYQSSRADISEILKDESRGASSFRIGRLSKALVMFEIALSCGLLVAAGLMIKSVAKLRNIDYGFETKDVFTARIGFPATYTDTLKQIRFFETLATRLATLPGARAASISSGLPGLGNCCANFGIEGASYAADKDYPEAGSTALTPGYFDTFGLTATQGRLFGSEDRTESLPVAIVNQSFVRKFFKDGNALGRRIRQGASKSKEPWRTIVGVVPDTYSGDREHPRREAIYWPLAQHHSNFVSLAVRSTGNPMSLTPQVRDAVASLDNDIPIYWVYSMTEALARPTWFIRVFGTIFMIFGIVALFLASVGLYAVMAFSVSRRRREVGIRMALGAQARDVVRLVFGQGIVQLAVGMTAGLALAAGVSQLMKIVLFDVQPRDPTIFIGVVLVLTVTGLMACWVPARRATRVDPLVALRSE